MLHCHRWPLGLCCLGVLTLTMVDHGSASPLVPPPPGGNRPDSATHSPSRPRSDPARYPIDAAREINDDLRALLVKIAPRKGAPSPEQVKQLRDLLQELNKFDQAIRARGAALGDEGLIGIRADMLHHRAISWMNAWWAFGYLAERASRLRDDEQRRGLLGLDLDSPLGLLLHIYAQIQEGEHDQAKRIRRRLQKEPNEARGKEMRDWLEKIANPNEPLRQRLADSTSLGEMLGASEVLPEEKRPKNFTHHYYVPTTADIIGSSNDLPKRDEHKFLSLWALVNLQLDTWHDLRAGASTLRGLTAWTRKFSSPELTADLSTFGALGSQLQARVGKVSQFLHFRERAAQDEALPGILENVYKARTIGRPTFQECLGDLIEAATPLPAGGGHCYDAEIWLRYVVLLSYQKDSAATADPFFWKEKWKLPGDLNLAPPAETPPLEAPADSSTFLRWDRWPVTGNLSAVLADLTTAALGYRDFTQGVSPKDGTKALDGRHTVLHEKLLALRSATTKYVEPYFAENGKLERFELVAAGDHGAGRSLSGLSWRERPRPSQGKDIWGESANEALRRRVARREPPLTLTHECGRLTQPWRLTTTTAEAQRIASDLTELAALLRSSDRLYSLFDRAYETGDSRFLAAAFRSESGYAAGPQWNRYALPQKPFRSYYEDLRTAARRLNDLSEEQAAREVESDLRHRYAQQGKIHEQARLRVAVVRLGRKVAGKALEISEQYRAIAGLEQEIASLRQQYARAILTARENGQKVAGLKLAYAARQRDLAEARLQALTAASEQAAELVAKATDELESLKGQLLETAKKIEDQKKKRGIFSIIKAVINVVGAVLAPFTGGASLAAAQLANMAVDIAQTIDQTDWSNFASAAAGVERITGQTVSAIDFGVGHFGSADMKKALGEYKSFLKSGLKSFDTFTKKAKPLLDQGKQLFEAGKQLNDALKQLPSNQNIAPLIAGLASGIPVSYESNKLRIDLSATHRFAFKKNTDLEKDLEKDLRDILRSGGALFNDVEFRKTDITGLLQKDEFASADKEKLAAYLSEIIKQCPDEVVKRFNPAVDKAQEQFRKSKEHLLGLVKNLDSNTCRSLAQILAGGMTVMELDGRVVAVAKEMTEEDKRFRERVSKFQERIANDEFQGLLDSINTKREKLIRKAQEFAGKEDEKGLRELADKGVADAIDKIRDDLVSLKAKVDEARGKLQDAEALKRIAEYDLEAAQYFVDAARLEVARAAKEAQKAQLGIDVARMALERDQLNIERSDLKIDDQVLQLEIAESELQHLYLKSIAHGFNPLLQKGREQGAVVRRPEDRLLNVLVGVSPLQIDTDTRFQLDRMSASLVGMLQWIRVLSLENRGNKEVSLAKLIEILSKPSTKADEKKKSLLDLAENADQVYQDNITQKLDVDFVEIGSIGGVGPNAPPIRWFNAKDKELDPWLGQLPTDSELRTQALGAFDLAFLLTLPAKITNVADSSHPTPIHRPGAAPNRKYYLAASLAEMVSKNDTIDPTGNLRFILVPPENPMCHPDEPIASPPIPASEAGDGKMVNQELVIGWKMRIANALSLSNSMDLTGAIGYWRVYLFSTKATTPEEQAALVAAYRKKFAEESKKDNPMPFMLELYIPYLRVKR